MDSMQQETTKSPKFCVVVDEIIRRIGHLFSWLNVILVFVIILQVFLRYVMGMGLVVLEEIQWHLYAVGIMFGLSYCVVQDTHIRLDLVYENLSSRSKEWVELLGNLLLLSPIVIIILIHSWDFFFDSWMLKERSDSPIGLPARYIIKSFLLSGFGFLALATFSKMVRSVAFLLSKNRPEEHSDAN
jgi:TRAP-type mannitol/chloroaromatic compound transport system permease small subunit